MQNKTVDARGMACPLPVVNAKKASEEMTEGGVLTVLVDNEIGAYLTCEGSDSLEDLKSLEAEGVKILTCGTCLDFYGLKEKLAVGGVTNMYEIVEIMENAGTIVRP